MWVDDRITTDSKERQLKYLAAFDDGYHQGYDRGYRAGTMAMYEEFRGVKKLPFKTAVG